VFKNLFEIANIFAWNFLNKFKNNFKPKDRQDLFRKMPIFGKKTKFFGVNFSIEIKSAPKINKI
jgi:hypothetical protein